MKKSVMGLVYPLKFCSQVTRECLPCSLAACSGAKDYIATAFFYKFILHVTILK